MIFFLLPNVHDYPDSRFLEMKLNVFILIPFPPPPLKKKN